MSIRKILTALDGSQTSESILAHVDPLLGKFGAEVTLATVVSEGSPRWGRFARDYLETLAKRLRAGGRCVDVAVLTGKAALEITQFAADEAYDILAVCTRGKSGRRRLLLGSVAEDILRRASVPLLVAHPPLNDGLPIVSEFRSVLLALDGSHRSDSILPWVSEVAKAYGAKVTLVTAVSPTRREGLPADTIGHNLFLEQKALQSQGLEVDSAVLYGDPATEILAFAAKNRIDLIATSPHGRTGLDRMREGSVTEAILRKNRTTMLVFRTADVVRDHPAPAREALARRPAVDVLVDVPGKGPSRR